MKFLTPEIRRDYFIIPDEVGESMKDVLGLRWGAEFGAECVVLFACSLSSSVHLVAGSLSVLVHSIPLVTDTPEQQTPLCCLILMSSRRRQFFRILEMGERSQIHGSQECSCYLGFNGRWAAFPF